MVAPQICCPPFHYCTCLWGDDCFFTSDHAWPATIYLSDHRPSRQSILYSINYSVALVVLPPFHLSFGLFRRGVIISAEKLRARPGTGTHASTSTTTSIRYNVIMVWRFTQLRNFCYFTWGAFLPDRIDGEVTAPRPCFKIYESGRVTESR